MRQRKLFKLLFTAIVILAVMSYFGCKKKTENTEQPPAEVETESLSPDTSSQMETPEITETVVERQTTIPELKGTWIGKFDKRSTVLNITEQTDSSFSGKITINYREVINQEVKGTISPSTMSMSMKDQLHNRFRGKYNGKLSEDGKNFSGTFTMDLDGSKFSFNLNKK